MQERRRAPSLATGNTPPCRGIVGREQTEAVSAEGGPVSLPGKSDPASRSQERGPRRVCAEMCEKNVGIHGEQPSRSGVPGGRRARARAQANEADCGPRAASLADCARAQTRSGPTRSSPGRGQLRVPRLNCGGGGE